MAKWGRSLWAIILIKLFIMFVILKVFFFPDILQRNFDSYPVGDRPAVIGYFADRCDGGPG